MRCVHEQSVSVHDEMTGTECRLSCSRTALLSEEHRELRCPPAFVDFYYRQPMRALSTASAGATPASALVRTDEFADRYLADRLAVMRYHRGRYLADVKSGTAFRDGEWLCYYSDKVIDRRKRGGSSLDEMLDGIVGSCFATRHPPESLGTVVLAQVVARLEESAAGSRFVVPGLWTSPNNPHLEAVAVTLTIDTCAMVTTQ
jgi:hypothetical protein